MKFGKQLELGCYEPWKAQYCAYSRLKRVIKRNKFILDTQRNKKGKSDGQYRSFESHPPDLESNSSANMNVTETTPLTMSSLEDRRNISERDLEGLRTPGNADRRHSHTSTYSSGNSSGNDNMEDFFGIIQEELDKVNAFYIGKIAELEVLLDKIVSRRSNAWVGHHTGGTSGRDGGDELRRVYIELSALRMYCSLNQTAFMKIIKKYDKVFEESNLLHWSGVVDKQTFSSSPEPMHCMDIIQNMVSRERLMEWDRQASRGIGPLSKNDILPAVRPMKLLFSLLVFILAANVPLVTPSGQEVSDSSLLHPTSRAPGRCLAVLLLVVSLWLSEAIPYYATSLLVAPLCIVMDVFKDPSNPHILLKREDASKMVMSNFINHTSMLLMGGFVISAAFSRCQLELRVASLLQGAFKNSPQLFILAIMMLGLFLSMWISNHTAPILVSTIVTPIVRDLPKDSRFSKTLLLGLAYACNFGGMMTPISSLQNALAVSHLEHSGIEIGFGEWIIFAVPFAVVCTLGAWLLIVLVCKPTDVKRIPVIVYEHGEETFSARNLVVISLSALTMLLFACSALLKEWVGDLSTISLVFVATLFGSGLLTEVDFNGLPWHILFLLGGGNILGKAVESSGLLKDIAVAITDILPLDDKLFAMLTIFSFAAAVATFVSHTVASLILMPVITQVGISLEAPQPVVIGTALAVSAAMALPFSSFPNVNSLLIHDDFRVPYLQVGDFVKTGLPLSIISVGGITLFVRMFQY